VTAVNPRFLGASNLTNMARLIGMYGIFSIGMGLVIITGGIDLSIGSVFALQGIKNGLELRRTKTRYRTRPKAGTLAPREESTARRSVKSYANPA
jgi:ABC-type xylose transport system permease subunit